MSFSNPKIENPAGKFIEFKGDTGTFEYYDKENEQKVKLDMPLYFVVLDELSTITGFNHDLQCGIYSNEVHNINNEILKVRSFKGNLQITGKYADIKNEIKSNSGKFCKSVYAMLITQVDNKRNYQLVNFKFKGGSFSTWLDKSFNVEKFGVCVKETSLEKSGNISYSVPLFSKFNIDDDMVQNAIIMDKQLQKYLEYYKNQQLEQVEKIEVKTGIPEIDDADFNEVRENAIDNNIMEETDDLPF